MNTLPLFEPEAIELGEWSSDDWATPRREAAIAVDVFGDVVDLDPATNDRALGLGWINPRRWATAREDGLSIDWRGRVWCNPPYSQPAPWVRKAAHAHAAGQADVQMLLKCDHTTEWFAEAWRTASAVALLRRRIKFVGPPGEESITPPWGCVVFGWLRSPRMLDRFVARWEAYGAHLVVGGEA